MREIELGLLLLFLYMFIQHIASNSHISIQISPTVVTLWFRRTVTLLSSRPEKVVADHLLHKARRANEKQLGPVTHTVGYFTEIKGVGASCGYLDDL